MGLKLRRGTNVGCASSRGNWRVHGWPGLNLLRTKHGWRIWVAAPSPIDGVGEVDWDDFERCRALLDSQGLFDRRFPTRSEAVRALEWAVESQSSRS